MNNMTSLPTGEIPAIERRKFVQRVEGFPRHELDRFTVNRKQRNTEDRMHAAAFGRLAVLEAPHLEFVVAECIETGEWIIIDGHTRPPAWDSGLIAAEHVPDTVNVSFYRCLTLDDCDRLFDIYDSRQAAKDTGDVVFGMLRSLGWLPSSPMLRAPGGLDMPMRRMAAIRDGAITPRGKDVPWLHSALREFLLELQVIDALNFGGDVEVPGVTTRKGKPKVRKATPPPYGFVVAAVLAMRRDDDDAAADLLRQFRDGGGRSEGDSFDAVYGLRHWKHSSARVSATSKKLTAPERGAADIIAFLLTYEGWRADPDALLPGFAYTGLKEQREHACLFMERSLG